jgi:hypothetical protein
MGASFEAIDESFADRMGRELEETLINSAIPAGQDAQC